jgi:SlyX protein
MSNKSVIDELRSEIENLQVKVAYQEDTIEQLNSIVTEHQSRLQHLQSFSHKVIEKLQSIETNDSSGSDEIELPPHY